MLQNIIVQYLLRKAAHKGAEKIFPPYKTMMDTAYGVRELNPNEDEYLKSLREMQAIFGPGYSIPRFPIHLNNWDMSYYTKNPQQLDNAGSFVKHEYNNHLKQDYINIHGFGMRDVLR